MQKLVLITLAAALFGNSAFAQTAQSQEAKADEPAKYLHLDFTIKDIDNGKVVSTRTYSTISAAGRSCSIRSGDKVPVPTDKSAFTYLDVGVNIDCSGLRLTGNQLALHVIADITGQVTDGSATVKVAGAPVELSPIRDAPIIRQNRWNSDAIVPLGKATTLCSFDGVATKRQMQIELTATLIP